MVTLRNSVGRKRLPTAFPLGLSGFLAFVVASRRRSPAFRRHRLSVRHTRGETLMTLRWLRACAIAFARDAMTTRVMTYPPRHASRADGVLRSKLWSLFILQ